MTRRTTIHALAAMLALATAGSAAAQADVTLLYDDTGNPMPLAQVSFVSNFDPATGAYSPSWNGYLRLRMHDDGQHGDGAAGDGVWGARVKVAPGGKQLYEWATDDNADGSDGWLGPCPPFYVEDASPKTVRGYSMPEEARLSAAGFAAKHGVDLSTARAPQRLADGKRVLFTYKAPEGAKRVFLAGDFNNWAKNDGGNVRDGRAAMFPAGGGVWFRTVELDAPAASYKFVAQMPDASFKWSADPFVPPAEDGGNSRIEPAQLPRTGTATP
ncbi:MAG: choice-of-anchor X domain-containing protein [Candidatus Sumerlaeia bacterium]|nr:choice-of-anchor X domain-containing protein [Candidatus Sumerlaeia bacterium]